MNAALRHRIERVARRQNQIDDEHEQERTRVEVDALLAGHFEILEVWDERLWAGLMGRRGKR